MSAPDEPCAAGGGESCPASDAGAHAFVGPGDHLVRVIAPALVRGDVVLCDRFTDATFAYQGAGRGFDQGVLSTLEQWVQSDEGLLGDPAGNKPMKPEVETVIEPHLTIWFDLPPEEAALRLAGARVPDKFEAQPLEFFRRVAQGYADRQQGHPERFARINASQAREAVWQAVRQVFVAKGWLP
ncbi:MAG: dTMP kinase [Polaromonas sp.]